MKIFNKFTTRLLLPLLALGLLASCEQQFKKDSGAKEITITYKSGGDPNHPDTDDFVFDPYELEITHGSNRVPIRLVIKSDGYSFPEDLRRAFWVDPDDGNIFIRSIGKNNKTLLLRDLNKIQETYKYGVIIIEDATGKEFRIDPRIKNGGGGGGNEN